MLTSFSTPQSTSVYSYGPTGMREKAVVTQGGATKVTESVWQGGRVAAERDSDGTLYRYVYAPDGTPLALERTPAGAPAEVFSYHTDAQGSVVAITGPSGSVVASYRYDAFGAVTAATGSDPIATRNPLRYRAYYLDASTSLYYLPARSYDPATARFLSQDPAPPSAGDPLSLNRYTYCEGDPVNLTDPTGAVIDVLGDGRVGVEDSVAQTYIYTPSGKAGSKQGARKAARREAMSTAAWSASRGNTRRDVARAAVGAFNREMARLWSGYIYEDRVEYGMSRLSPFLRGGFVVGWDDFTRIRNGEEVDQKVLEFRMGLGISTPGYTRKRTSTPPPTAAGFESGSVTLMWGVDAHGDFITGTPAINLLSFTWPIGLD